MNKQAKSVSQTEEQRSVLQAICRRRKVDTLVWKLAFAKAGLSFFGLKDNSHRQGRLSVTQEQKLRLYFCDQPPSNAVALCVLAYTIYKTLVHGLLYHFDGAEYEVN